MKRILAIMAAAMLTLAACTKDKVEPVKKDCTDSVRNLIREKAIM